MNLSSGAAPLPVHLPERPDEDYFAERVATLFSTSPSTAVGNLFSASLIFGVYHSSVPLGGLIVWWCLLLVLMCVRLGLVRAYRRNPRRVAPRTWARLTSVQCASVGLTWGIGAIWLMHYGTPFEDVVYGCVALTSVMVAMSNVSYWPAHLSFHVPMFFFLGIAYFLDPEPVSHFLAIGAWVVCPFIAEMGRRLQMRFNAALKLAWEHQVLAHKYALAAQELAVLSRTDDLTRIANKRHLDETLSREWHRCLRNGEPLGVLMLDIDHFKRFNDTYGHLAGDTCIRQVAEAMRGSIREHCDFVARFGGEEFTVVMPGAGLDTALVIAERIRAAVEALRLRHEAVERGQLTVSIGVASTAQGEMANAEALVGHADVALYAAKHAGRNRVAAADIQDLRKPLSNTPTLSPSS
ncbi:GGDEF domain-containing protein [Pseudomonas sp. UL073]|uniref:diguanylate cyclase n=1 Tax=Zestomonas insulae TaxID=2809017 RepID=A0ABS2I9C5_9GAMM|nr:GGDEF domain-containing protein [Pseudomonas insulae]MBM7059719.1 GGDEF domain-containing protein [Pseudomonas insulae]